MRRIGLLALLVALTTPAWAADVPAGDPNSQQSWSVAALVCQKTGGSLEVCFMKHIPSEAQALSMAQSTLTLCGKYWDSRDYYLIAEMCVEARAYIKRRWGY